MKILQIVDKAPQDGGTAVHAFKLAASLRARGDTVKLLQLKNDPHSGLTSTPDSYQMPWSYGFVPGWRLRGTLQRILNEFNPDIVHIHGCFTTLSPPLLSEIRRSKPVVGTLHDIRPFCFLMTRRLATTRSLCTQRCGLRCFSSGCVPAHGLIDAARLARRWLMDSATLDQWRKLSRIIVPSTYMLELASQHGVPAHRLRLVTHGTHVPATLPIESKNGSPARILFLGGLIEYKGIVLFIKALQLLPRNAWEAIIVGDGPMRGTVEQELANMGLSRQVTLYGHIGDRSAIEHLLANARMLVIPSIIPESFSLSGIEALAMGTPVVSFGLGGIAEWLRDGENGLIAAADDIHDLARQIKKLLDDSTLAKSMGMRGRQLVRERFTESNAVSGLLAVYNELCPSSAQTQLTT